MKSKLWPNSPIPYTDVPSGLLTIATAKEKEYTLYHFVLDYIKSKDKHNKIFIIHRLDKETSGIVIFAKNQKTKNLFQNSWDRNTISRNYYAVVEGNVSKSKVLINKLLKDTKNNIVKVDESGKLSKQIN